MTEKPLFAIAPRGKAHFVRMASLYYENGVQRGSTRCGLQFYVRSGWVLTSYKNTMDLCAQCIGRRKRD